MIKKSVILKGIIKNKKAESDSILESPVIFILLNLIFFALLFAFVVRSASGAVIYERAHAKDIALYLDRIEAPGTIFVDITGGAEVAEKNNIPIENTISINNEDNLIITRFSTKGPYSYHFFSSYNARVVGYGTKYLILPIDVYSNPTLLGFDTEEQAIQSANQQYSFVAEAGSDIPSPRIQTIKFVEIEVYENE